jgi:hypothetical protein
LVGKTGFVERAKQRTTSLSPQEEIDRVEQGWKNWDQLLYKTGCAPAQDLVDWVAKPVQRAINRQETVISASDQILVWLKPDSGKRLVPKAQISAAQQAKKRRVGRKVVQHQEPTEQEVEEAGRQPRDLVATGGNPANSRSRHTLVARQLVKNYFKQGQIQSANRKHVQINPWSIRDQHHRQNKKTTRQTRQTARQTDRQARLHYYYDYYYYYYYYYYAQWLYPMIVSPS